MTHEIVEAITNPFNDAWYDNSWDADQNKKNEIADKCQPPGVFTFDGVYRLAPYFSRATNSCLRPSEPVQFDRSWMFRIAMYAGTVRRDVAFQGSTVRLRVEHAFSSDGRAIDAARLGLNYHWQILGNAISLSNLDGPEEILVQMPVETEIIVVTCAVFIDGDNVGPAAKSTFYTVTIPGPQKRPVTASGARAMNHVDRYVRG
jgi:hypothetical protein